MKKFLEICGGIDVGKREIAVTILKGPTTAEPTADTRIFGTTTPALQQCLGWLLSESVATVVMESTGSYWTPVWNVFSEKLGVILANPDHVKARRGEKTDPMDSRRLAERLRVGDVRGSFIPTEPTRRLRDLTRRRKKLLGTAASERNRIQKLLEQGNVKFGNVVSDVFGTSGQRILDALLNHPNQTSAEMAELALGKLRSKMEHIRETLDGHRLDDHLRYMIQKSLDYLVFIEGELKELGEKIAEAIKPQEREYELLQTIPGISAETAAVILAETGGNMAQFPSDKHLTSWAGVCPGNNRSAGKQTSGAIKRGNRWLLSALVQASWGAVRKRGSIFKKRFYRLSQHRGRKRAVIGAARCLLVVVWHILSEMRPYLEEPNEEMQKREVSKKVLHHLR
jgi:transposase